MFLLHTMKDTIRISADSLAVHTVSAIQNEIDVKYPNRVLMDVGLVIGRYDDVRGTNDAKNDSTTTTKNIKSSNGKDISSKNHDQNKRQRRIPKGDGGLIRIGHGVCVAGDSGSHHECTFQLIIFRPFVNEVCVGIIMHSSADGIQVSLGFFNDIFIPAYWMLSPSYYDNETGLWVWTPQYDDDDNEQIDGGKESSESLRTIKNEESIGGGGGSGVKSEDVSTTKVLEDATNRYEMEIGSEIRFKVKSINFTQVTNTAKGMQSTTISMGSSATSAPTSSTDSKGGQTRSTTGGSSNSGGGDDASQPFQRRRSSSVSGVDDVHSLPSTMQIIGSICEDGLGLTSWWTSAQEYDDEDGDVEGMTNYAADGEVDDEIGEDEEVDGEHYEEY
jgi:DNA-directed RNA polymerase III subunit RPC8